MTVAIHVDLAGPASFVTRRLSRTISSFFAKTSLRSQHACMYLHRVSLLEYTHPGSTYRPLRNSALRAVSQRYVAAGNSTLSGIATVSWRPMLSRNAVDPGVHMPPGWTEYSAISGQSTEASVRELLPSITRCVPKATSSTLIECLLI